MHDRPEITLDRLAAEPADLLPHRETLCSFACTNVVNVVGVNLALAINAASIHTQATAVAQQYLTAMR